MSWRCNNLTGLNLGSTHERDPRDDNQIGPMDGWKRIVFKVTVPTKLRSDRSEQSLPSVDETRYVSDPPKPLGAVISAGFFDEDHESEPRSSGY